MKELLRLYRSNSRYIYFVLLTILAATLPISRYLISMCEIGLLINFIIEGDFRNRFRIVSQNKSLLVFLCIYAVHLIWLIGTNDFAYASENLKIKLPLLVLPVIIVASGPLDYRWIKILLKCFVVSVVLATLYCAAVYFGFTGHVVDDVRKISVFISHIRFSLMIVVAILILLNWIVTEGWKISRAQIISALIIVWLIVFLILLKAFTGIIVLGVTTLILIMTFIRSVKFKSLKLALIIILFAIPLLSFIFIRNEIKSYYNFEKFDVKTLEKKTINGNTYYHDPLDWNVENGNKVWMYVCQTELRQEWNKRSNYKFDSLDKKKQPLIYSLIRYMTSKGLRKDSVGVSKLTPVDIRSIEHGITNVIYNNQWGLKPRIYEVIWEIDQYKHGSAVNEHSVTQRIIYMQIALHIIKDNFWFGIGTGDLPQAYTNYYKTHDTGLAKERQMHTHNQFLRFFVMFGLIGFLIIFAAFLLPVFIERKWSSYYIVMIITIILLSFLNEDTLETQIGLTFAVLFYAVFMWGIKKDTDTDKQT